MVRSKLLIIVAFIVLFSQLTKPVVAQNLKLKTGEWLQNWYLAGPFLLEEGIDEYKHLGGFENDFLDKLGGESNPRVKNGEVISVTSGSAKWKYYKRNDFI